MSKNSTWISSHLQPIRRPRHPRPPGLPYLKRQALLKARDEAMLRIEREDEERQKMAAARLAAAKSRK